MDTFHSHPHGTTALHVASYYNLVGLASAILDNTEQHSINVDAVDDRGLTPILRAAEQGHSAIVKLLLKKGNTDVNSKDKAGWTLTEKDSVFIAIVKEKLFAMNVVMKEFGSKKTSGWTPLSLAANKGHEAVVKLLLETGNTDIDLTDKEGWTLLVLAAHQGHESVVKLLLNTGKADVSLKDNNGWSVLSWAAHTGQEGIVKLLLMIGKAEVGLKDMDGRTLLSWAAGRGHDGVVKMLLETGKADVRSKDNHGQTPLSWAEKEGHESVLKLL